MTKQKMTAAATKALRVTITMFKKRAVDEWDECWKRRYTSHSNALTKMLTRIREGRLDLAARQAGRMNGDVAKHLPVALLDLLQVHTKHLPLDMGRALWKAR